ncbi:hypothetical protein ABH940_005419 [Streptacidiphilus sp. BW17]|uniref:DUF742 domain-containing protein n=1 Tax=Streptacidiphilus sp. BW17 TaxID=3156274 RepID=UPI003512B6BA
MTVPGGRRRLVPAYLATGGLATPSRNTLDRMTVLTCEPGPRPADLTAPARRVLDQLGGGALTLVEVAAYVGLPPSITRVIASDLVDRGLLRAHASLLQPRSTVAKAERISVLERVLHGLRRL